MTRVVTSKLSGRLGIWIFIVAKNDTHEKDANNFNSRYGGNSSRRCEKRKGGVFAGVSRASIGFHHITNRRVGGGSGYESASFSYTLSFGIIE